MQPPQRQAPLGLRARPRVVVLGDSVIAGYGVGGRSYADTIAERLHAERTMSYARSTFTVLDTVRLLDRVRKFEPSLALVNVGGSEALVHAGAAVERLLERFAPKSWRGVEGLEMKPVQRPPGRVARTRQVITGYLKLVLKHVGVRITGGYRRVTPDVFEPKFRELLQALDDLGCVTVVIGLHTPDEFFWPRSTASGLEYEVATQRVLQDFPNALFFDPKPILHRWDDFLSDHAHFNDGGHRKVADLVWEGLRGHAPITDDSDGSAQVADTAEVTGAADVGPADPGETLASDRHDGS